YSRYPHGIERAFIDAAKIAARLLRAEIRVYSPIVHCHPLAVHGGIDPLDHSIWLPFNEPMLIVSDLLLVAHMDGWRESIGVGDDIKFFEEARKPIFDLIDPEAIMMVRRQAARPARDRIDGVPIEDIERQRRAFLGHGEQTLAHDKSPSEQSGASV